MVVRDGRSALAVLASLVPAIIVLDLHLPDVTGEDVLRQARKKRKLAQVPVIVATAYPDEAQQVEELVDLVLIKPVRFDVLQDKAIERATPRETGP